MGALVVGLSYRTAPLALLERASLDTAQRQGLELRLSAGEHIGEAVVLSTCNRLEVYTAAERFHGGLAEVGEALTRITGLGLTELTDHLYVHYEAAAVGHIFSVAAGLDSMALGEQQILGQVRAALRDAQRAGTVGHELTPLLQQALRVGKRAHAETELDLVGRDLVQAGLDRAAALLGPADAVQALVVGAGTMSGLAVATLRRCGVESVGVLSRTLERAERLAATVGGLAHPMADLETALTGADLVICCAGAPGYLIQERHVKAALAARDDRPQAYLDLALPRDVDPRVADLDGALLVDLAVLGEELSGPGAVGTLGAPGTPGTPGTVGAAPERGRAAEAVARARALVHEEVQAFLSARATATEVAPTVVALRGLASAVVDAELERLRGRLGGRAADDVVAEVEQTVHRVVDKLLHTPTVRVKQLASEPDGQHYTEALRALFGLDLASVSAVTGVAEPDPGGER